MALTPGLVYEVATALLTCVADGLESHDVEVPERQYVHLGEVSLDCCDPGQLVVAVSGLVHAPVSGDASPLVCAPPRSVVFDIWLNRCVPTLTENGDPPSAADLDASAETLLTDLWTLAYVLWETYSDGCWPVHCSSVLLGPVVPYGPEGACGGSHATVTINLT